MKFSRNGRLSAFVIILAFILTATTCGKTNTGQATAPSVPLLQTSISKDSAVALRLVYSDVEAFPIQMGNGETVADPPGVAIELIAEAARQLGLPVKFERLPNKRVFSELEAGIADGAFCFSYKEDRLKSGVYPLKDGKPDSSRRIITISYYLYKMKHSSLNWDGKNFSNLNGRIGANSGYSIVDDLRKMGLPVEEAKTTEQNFVKLQLERIAGYATQDITADRIVESGQDGDIVKVIPPLTTKDYFLMFSHQFMEKHPDIAEQLWAKIGELRETFTKNALNRYQ